MALRTLTDSKAGTNGVQLLREEAERLRRANWKPVIPYVFYRDQFGRSYALVNRLGKCRDPDDGIEKEDGRVLKRITYGEAGIEGV